MWNGLRRKRKLACQQVETQLMAYLKEGLSSAREQAIREHLSTCDACARSVREIEALQAGLLAEAARHTPQLSPQASARIQERVYRRMRRRLIMQRTTHIAGRAAALAAILALTMGAMVLWQRESSDKETTGGLPASDPSDVTVITFAYPEYLTAFNQANYQRLADAFNAENPDLRVELRTISTQELMETGGDYLNMVFDEQLGVDVFLNRDLRGLLGDAHLLDLGPLIALHPEFDRADFYPLAWDRLSQNGGVWGIPAEIDLVVFYYNKDLFDQARVAYPAADWTREDFLDTTVALRQGLPEQEIAFAGQVDEAAPFIYAHGGSVKKGSDYTLTDPRTVEAVRWFADLALVYGVMPLPARLELYEPEPRAGWGIGIQYTGEGEAPEAELRWGMIGAKASIAAQEGDAALWSDTLSVRQGSGGWNWAFGWGVVPWPRDQEEVAVSQTLAYFVSANTPHPEAVLRWIDFLTRQPPQLKGIPARRSVAGSESVRRAFTDQIGAEAYAACLRAIQEATPVDYGIYLVAERYLGQALLDILENGKDVETALSEAQAALEAP
jgi:ABC-type glycerol-3-phosphate transport system substrate-binding protein